MSIKVSAHTTP